MSDIPNNFVAKTDIGSFQIKITNRDYISIGAKNNCVQIGYNHKTNSATLDWLGTEKGGCEINDKNIHGDNTVTMTNLGFTLLKQLYPNVNPIITLRDSSKFTCRLHDTIITMSSMIFMLLLKGETYYQSRFKATLKYKESEESYENFVKAWKTPVNKSYDFRNEDLNKKLQPLLLTSNSWEEFFKNMYTTFGRNCCILMHSWYLDIYGFLAKQPIHSDWIIDISNQPFVEYSITSRNSTNYTRKSFDYNPHVFGGYFPSFISYKKLFRKPTVKSKTLKCIKCL